MVVNGDNQSAKVFLILPNSRFNVKLLKVGSGRSRGRKVGGNLLQGRHGQVRIVIPPDSKHPGYKMVINGNKWS